MAGAQLRYLLFNGSRLLGGLGFGASAWSLADRDRLIGWSSTQRQRNLHLVLNNDRFLLLPWVRCPNLASRVLGLVCRRLAADWFSHYGYRPVLLETENRPSECYRLPQIHAARKGTFSGLVASR